MGKFICIHGHFYQPPRENPWLEAIELQDSAAPYHDWNECISSECYAPNARARVLDGAGKIGELVNNYAMISFNYGPTLLSWMRQHIPEIYQAVRDADALSRKNFSGHGSALAQAYNHMILPLANDRDKRTQVIWGIRDFEHHFGRAPEGMWLPETAADTPSLECLADLGLKFTILAPQQARRVRRIGEAEWQDVNGSRIDPRRPYVCRLPSGKSINLFFYDGPIARAVAFEHLLDKGERLVDRLMGGFDQQSDQDQLVHIATDGESYGHHHRYGEMALAWALRTIVHCNNVKVTNYGEYLETHPPAYEVEIHEKSSWSCVHGIGRWYTNCGCNGGGYPAWNQGWRGPLRHAFDWLRDVLSPLYESQASRYVRDPWAARDDYVSVLLQRSREQFDLFLSRNAHHILQPSERIELVKLMEIQRHTMLMYSSCGWFFDELSGVETVQVIQYAARAVQLAKEVFGLNLEPQFLQHLGEAKSNIPEHRDGATIYNKWIKPATIGWHQAAAHYAIGSIFQNQGTREKKVFTFTFEDLDREMLTAGKARLAVGRIEGKSELTEESALMSYAVFYMGEQNLTAGVRHFISPEMYSDMVSDLKAAFGEVDFPKVIRAIAKHFGESCYSLKSLFRDEQRRVLHELLETTRMDLENRYRRIAERYVPLMTYLGDLGKSLLPAVEMAANFVLRVDLHREFSSNSPNVPQLRRLLQQAGARPELFFDVDLSYAVATRMEQMMAAIAADPLNLPRIKLLDQVAETVLPLPLDLNLWKVQNTYWEMLHAIAPRMSDRARAGDEQAQSWLAQFLVLGDRLGFTVPQHLSEPAV